MGESPMQLIYRGLTFDYNPSKTPERFFHTSPRLGAAYTLMYRGVTYRIDPNSIEKAAPKPATYELSYRGVTYKVNRNEQDEVTVISSSLKPSNHKIPTTADSAIQQKREEVPSILTLIKKLWQNAIVAITTEPELKIWQKQDRNGHIHWYVYDPLMSKSISFASELEMLSWLEDFHSRSRW
jgi:Domain of unknown function (DUF4278)